MCGLHTREDIRQVCASILKWPPSGVVENGNGYRKYTDVTSVDECKDKCNNESKFKFNAIAFGDAGCYTYHNCKIINDLQDWGQNYYLKES